MSAQSIIEINKNQTCDLIDEFLIQEGNHFRNVTDYDLCSKVEYDKIRTVLRLKEIMLKNNLCDNNGIDVAITINKILK